MFHAQVMGEDGAEAPPTKKRRVGAGVERPKGVASQFRPADVSDVKEVSRMFEGKEFCVVNGPKELSKEKAERKIAEVREGERGEGKRGSERESKFCTE